ncbi:MAG: hypothetical protein KBS96_03595 [Lachnospiraceae bacterium]|nr:hypothetical protein [Candidatus Colinaster scatohippi]
MATTKKNKRKKPREQAKRQLSWQSPRRTREKNQENKPSSNHLGNHKEEQEKKPREQAKQQLSWQPQSRTREKSKRTSQATIILAATK